MDFCRSSDFAEKLFTETEGSPMFIRMFFLKKEVYELARRIKIYEEYPLT